MTIDSGISVLLPTNKINDWLDLSINSLLQSVDVEFEVILILDGVKFPEWRNWMDDFRVKIVIIDESKGLPHALNVGISHTKFSIIGRLDGDDLISKERLSRQYQYFVDHPEVSAVGSRVILIDHFGSEIGELPGTLLNQDIRKKLLLRNLVAHPSLAFRKSCLDQIGGYNEQMSQMEDYEFILRLGLCGEVHNLDLFGLYYRVHSNQMSRSFNAKNTNLRVVSSAKKALAKKINISPTHAGTMIIIWKLAEITRSLGIRKPRYLALARAN